jgi:hypothetical protein
MPHPPVKLVADLEYCDFTVRRVNQSPQGIVNFFTHRVCTIQFSNADVFGKTAFPAWPDQDLQPGDNPFTVVANPPPGTTLTTAVSIVKGCNPKEGLKIMIGPTDIIVP